MRRRDHVLRFADKKIEVRRGRHHVFSMWKGVRVGRRGEIVPEQFRKVRGVWAQVSWMGRTAGDWWLLAILCHLLSKGRTSEKTVRP